MIKTNEYVGVMSPFDLMKTSLKKEAIFFDKIAIPNITNDFFLKDLLLACPIRSIEYLIDSGIIIDPVKKYIGENNYIKKIGKDIHQDRLIEIENIKNRLAKELSIPLQTYPVSNLEQLFKNLPKNLSLIAGRFIDAVKFQYGVPISKISSFLALYSNQLEYDRRGIAIDLRCNNGVNAFPLYPENIALNGDFPVGKDEIVNLIFEQLPEPDYDTVGWEQIIDYRSDPETKKFLIFIRNWATNVSKGTLTSGEIIEQMQYSCAKYEEHINLHKIKLNYGSLETLMMIPAEMIEGVLRLKPTKIVKAIFKFKRQKVQLLEKEINAPGRDLAYVLKSKEYFGNTEN